MKFRSFSTTRALLAIAAGASLASLGTSQAAVTLSTRTNVAPAGTPGTSHDPSSSGAPEQFAPSATDLINGLTGTVTYTGGTGSTVREDSAGASAWTNGSITTTYGGAGVPDAIAHAAYGVVDATVGGSNIDTFVTFDLGSAFNLTAVNVFMGWNDSGRDDSSFNLLVSSDNITFTQIAGYLKPADNTGAITTPVTNLHSISDDLGGFIANDVRYVQFQFTDADNGYAGLAEIDILGTAIPEPGSAMLLSLAGLAAAGLRRRK